MSRLDAWLWRAALGFGLLATFAAPMVATAAVPTTMQVDGVLMAQGGGAVVDGPYKLTFALWDAATDGAKLWSETVDVGIGGGRFVATLGAGAALDPKLLASGKVWLGVAVGLDPELPRRPLSSGAYALRAAIADAVECSGCVTATALGFNYAGSATKGGAATDVACTACVSVSELKFDGDVDLGGNSLKGANATFTGDVAAKTVTATSFAGDGSKLTGISQPKGACKAGEAVVGIAADGALQCQAFSAALPADGLDEVSNGLLTTQFTETVALGAAVGIPDNTGASANVKVDVPDWGVAQGLTIKVKVSNTDLSTLSLKLLPPDDKKVGITLCDPCGAKDAKALDTAWSDKVAPKSGDLAAWVGGNAKGSWNLVALDTGFCLKQAPGNGALCDLDNKLDGAVDGFTIEVATLSTQKVAANGVFVSTKGVDFASAPNKGFRHEVADADPVQCDASQTGYTYYNSKDAVLYLCDGKAFQPIAAVAPGSTQATAGKSCKDLLDKGALKSGPYWIRPTSNKIEDGFQVWCEQQADGGGWTLAMRMKNDAGLIYASAWWSNGEVFNDSGDDVTPSLNTNAKFDSYNALVGNEVRGCKGVGDSCQQMTYGGNRTLLTALNASWQSGSLDRNQFVAAFGNDGGQPNCNQSGTNLKNGNAYTGARFGLQGNNENDCTTSDAAWGWGVFGGGNAANGCGCGLAGWSVPSACFQGTLWVR